MREQVRLINPSIIGSIVAFNFSYHFREQFWRFNIKTEFLEGITLILESSNALCVTIL